MRRIKFQQPCLDKPGVGFLLDEPLGEVGQLRSLRSYLFAEAVGGTCLIGQVVFSKGRGTGTTFHSSGNNI